WKVHLRNQCIGDTRFHPARPPDDEGHSGAPLEDAVFAAAPWPAGFVVAQLLTRLVLVTVINDRTVVAGENDEGPPRQIVSFERREQFTHAPVELQNRIPARTHAALSREARM